MGKLAAVLPTLSSGLVQLHAAFQGEIVSPGDPAYEEARKVWNGMIDRYPALILRPVSTAGVVQAVNYARERDMPVSYTHLTLPTKRIV